MGGTRGLFHFASDKISSFLPLSNESEEDYDVPVCLGFTFVDISNSVKQVKRFL